MKPDFVVQRKENLQMAVPDTIPERTDFSILCRFYAKGIKKFSQFKHL